ncbi:hypothetical protein AND_010084 [Anopheles darlingi]|uniref:Secreted protein n=1 Tax=Anopheles darlingi TaxID=43151 RepID=W5J656_ANODA|nr:hypothetical protein AND_010084 [Anopheles darlingi]
MSFKIVTILALAALVCVESRTAPARVDPWNRIVRPLPRLPQGSRFVAGGNRIVGGFAIDISEAPYQLRRQDTCH